MSFPISTVHIGFGPPGLVMQEHGRWKKAKLLEGTWKDCITWGLVNVPSAIEAGIMTTPDTQENALPRDG
jgi:hypothetical protein